MRPEVSVSRSDRTAASLCFNCIFLNARPFSLPTLVPAFAVANFNSFKNAMRLMEIGATKLSNVYDSCGKMVRPSLVAGEVTEHSHVVFPLMFKFFIPGGN
jgi:hypothetical protein